MRMIPGKFPGRLPCIALLAIILLGAFLRLSHLGTASLWIDEITFVNESNPASSVIEIGRHMLSTYRWQHQPALPRMIESLFLRLVRWMELPVNDATYRLPAALMGIASLFVFYLLARKLFDERVGLVSALLLSISFFHIYYSREAYNYSPFLLCALLSWYVLTRILGDVRQLQVIRKWDLILYAFTTSLTLQMLMAGIMFVFSQFLAIMLTFYLAPLRELTSREKSRRLRPIFVAHLIAWLPFLPFLRELFHYENSDRAVHQTITPATFLRLVGEMGWSSQTVPLALFYLLILAGVWIAWRQPQTRFPAALCLLIGLFSAVGVGYAEQLGRFETRYFIVVLPMLLLFVAVALVALTERTTARCSAAIRAGVMLVPCILLLVWNCPFYKQLFQLRGKSLCGRAIAEWINHHTPVGSAYIVDSSFTLREVPGFYQTPGRHGWGPPASFSIEDYKQKNIRGFYEDVFRRFPDCFYIDTEHVNLTGSPAEEVAWCQRLFRQHAQIENPAITRLLEMRIFPSGVFLPLRSENYTTDIYYNTREDLVEMKRAAGECCLALFGAEWIFCQTPTPNLGYELWKGIHSRGRIFVHGLGSEPIQCKVMLNCASYESNQTIFVQLRDRQAECHLRAGQAAWFDLGEMRIQPGQNQITVWKAIPQRRDELANLLVHEVKLVPRARAHAEPTK